jgi:hypothetical protein
MNVPENGEPRALTKPDRTRLIGIILLMTAVSFWVAAPAVVFVPLPTGQKVWASSAFLILGEVAFWAAALALGREVFRRYRRFLAPRDWFGKARR